MKKASYHWALLIVFACVPLWARKPQKDASGGQPTLKITSRAVLVDVIVTDKHGNPVTGLSKDAFSVTDQGKPQAVTFFEEHGSATPAPRLKMPKLPQDVFTNFSPFPLPPAVNVLLLDSLNTAMTYQVFIHSQVIKFAENTKPGTRTAIFTMGMNLRLIQGFTDDPAALEAALDNKKNIEVETPTLMKLQAEKSGEQALLGMMSQNVDSHGSTLGSSEMTGTLQNFFNENDSSRSSDRMLITLTNLNRLAAFLAGVPGRKNIIWFAQKVPAVFNVEGGTLQLGNPAIGDEIRKTLATLAAERAAIYPVDPRGLKAPNETIDTVDSTKDRNSDQLNAQLVAEQSGGRAFANTNGIAGVIQKVASDGQHFYTLSYTPTNKSIDRRWHKIDVKVEGGKYNLSYRRGYFAADAATPESKTKMPKRGALPVAAASMSAVAPLLPFMGLGMPQSEQILYKIRIVPSGVGESKPAENKDQCHYAVDFAVDLNDLKLRLGKDGIRKGSLIVSLMIYDRYGNLVSRQDHLAALDIKPDGYAELRNTGVQLHADVATPQGNYWLRTGIYDENSRKVGTLEIPLAAVKPVETAASR